MNGYAHANQVLMDTRGIQAAPPQSVAGKNDVQGLEILTSLAEAVLNGSRGGSIQLPCCEICTLDTPKS